MLLFGLTQILVSQIPDFHNMTCLSVVAAIMSFTYAFIGLGLGFATLLRIYINPSSELLFFLFYLQYHEAIIFVSKIYDFWKLVLQVTERLREV